LLIGSLFARYASLLIVNFLAIYSGYGFFLGVATPIMLLAEIVRVRHNGRALVQATLALIIALFSLATFFNGWIFTPAAPCFRFPIHPWIRYAWFAALMLANPFRLKEHGLLPSVIGFCLLALVIWIAFRRLLQLARKQNASPLTSTSAILFGFSLLYVVAAAIGRACFGIDAADESRYVVFTSLAVFGFYLESLALSRTRAQRACLIVLFVGMCAANFYPDHRDSAQAQFFSEAKRKWKECYLQYEDIARCDGNAGGVAYPNPAVTHLKEKLDYLKANRLNLFSGE
jgi:amino acid permease